MMYRLPTSACLFAAAMALITAWMSAVSADSDDTSVTPEQREFVQAKVLPLLQARCFECHDDAEEPKGGLLLTSRTAALNGGDSGAAIVPGKPDQSLLVEAIRYEGLEMPPRSRMPEAEIDILESWIRMGAPWPADLESVHPTAVASKPFPLAERRAAHWAWQPIVPPVVPDVQDETWATDSLDRFVLSGLDAAKLTPAGDADRRTLLRRLYLDLTGLTPTPEQVQAFVDDRQEDGIAMAAVVDQLLASPQFGERWGRHWLDLVRYAETLGHEFDYPLHHAWQYRDYVIRALNADVPYDEFIREHIAGDLLEEPRLHPVEQYNESLIATGFWFLHEDKHAPVDVEYEEAVKVDNQIDVFARTFMGLTVACARCHDHKFDAISTKDYYSLFGVLQSSRRQTGWLDPGRRIAATTRKFRDLRERADAQLTHLRRQDAGSNEIARYLQATTEVLQGQPASGELPDADLPETRRSLQVVAAERDCHPQLLRSWVERLGQDQSADLSDGLSMLARIAQAPTESDRQAAIKQWVDDATDASRNTGASELYADFRQGVPAGWTMNGPAFDSRDRALVAAGASPFPVGTTGFSSADLSPKFRGSLFSPTFELTHPEILVRIAGEGARIRLVIDGYVMMEFNALLFRGIDQKVDTKGEFQWIRLAGDMHRYLGRHAYIEIMDQSDGWFVVDQVRFATRQKAAPPTRLVTAASLELVQELSQDDHPPVLRVAARVLWPTLFAEGLLPSSADSVWQSLQSRWATLAVEAPTPVPVLAATDGTGEDQSVFIRGNHRNPGDVVPRSFLEAISGDNQPLVESGSGRRELADRVLAEDNPFPARVAVNRIWHHIFGRGIVASTDDFGVLGAQPSHPELLDHLAADFRAGGWSVKQLIRRLVLSRTYRMSSVSSSDALEQDPANILLHSTRVRRLQGEAIRDVMLQLAGRLDLTTYGPSVPVALTSFMQGRGRPKGGPLDGNGRRSIYVSVNRNFLSPFMLAFDTPAPMSTRGRRSVSNVPAQALIMLNDEFAHQQAGRWAERLQEPPSDIESMIQRAWQQALGRPATDAEWRAVYAFAKNQAAQHDETLTATKVGPRTLQDVCHAIMNTKEFIYVR